MGECAVAIVDEEAILSSLPQSSRRNALTAVLGMSVSSGTLERQTEPNLAAFRFPLESGFRLSLLACREMTVS